MREASGIGKGGGWYSGDREPAPLSAKKESDRSGPELADRVH